MDAKCPTEIAITDRREFELSNLGFLPLCHYKNTDYSVFFGANTTQKPKKYDRPEATANAAISSRLPYIMASSRFAHYLKVMARDKIGSLMEAPDVERWLNRWIMNYVNSAEGAGQDMRAQYPLREAQIRVQEVPGKPGSYNAVAYLRPWLVMEELTTSLRMVARIPAASRRKSDWLCWHSPVNDSAIAIDDLIAAAVAVEGEAVVESGPSIRDAVFTGRFLGNRDRVLEDALTSFLAGDDRTALAAWLPAGWKGSPEETRAILDRDVAVIDEMLSVQLDAVLHNERFRRLEGAWRGLAWLVGGLDSGSRLKAKLLNVSWSEICRDLERAIEFDQSHLFRKIYEDVIRNARRRALWVAGHRL